MSFSLRIYTITCLTSYKKSCILKAHVILFHMQRDFPNEKSSRYLKHVHEPSRWSLLLILNTFSYLNAVSVLPLVLGVRSRLFFQRPSQDSCIPPICPLLVSARSAAFVLSAVHSTCLLLVHGFFLSRFCRTFQASPISLYHVPNAAPVFWGVLNSPSTIGYYINIWTHMKIQKNRIKSDILMWLRDLHMVVWEFH